MTPTLAYITSDIGPTSTGEHLDVKDVTGARFQENALDNFVEVADPELEPESLVTLRLFTVTKLLFNCLMAGVSVSYMVKLHDTIPLLY
jgi:hypothetical protein